MIPFWSVSHIRSLTKNAGFRDSVRKDDQTLSRDKDLKGSVVIVSKNLLKWGELLSKVRNR